MTHAQPKPIVENDVDGDELTPIDRDNPPSWFARTYGDASPREMANQYKSARPLPGYGQPVIAENTAAYEAYRKRLEERSSTAQREADPVYVAQARSQTETGFPTRPTYAYGMNGQGIAAAQKRPLGVKPVTFAMLAMFACGLGGGAGYLGANPERAAQIWSSGLAVASVLWGKNPNPVSETVITKKTVKTAKLEVNDAEGSINAPIALDISALPADPETPVALRISGLPPSAYLTKGVEVSEGQWMLKASEITQAELIVPQTDSALLDLQVYALEEKTGAAAAPSQELRVKLDTSAVPVPGVPPPKTDVAVIMPASAVPNQGFNKQDLPAAIPVPLETLNPEAQSLMSKGQRLLNDGDVLAARQFFLKAFDMKVTSAAFGVGQTYDPVVYAKHNIKGLVPNIEAAADWYGKAAAGGNADATAALAELPSQP
jgi:hypothetical protein